mmetsp:Transcript_72542/g.172996  ORF Transcript_72542/g.172996 Transcript_72542/m.172996 type:complete len:989 (-) Transcript_72542:42-3008(-)
MTLLSLDGDAPQTPRVLHPAGASQSIRRQVTFIESDTATNFKSPPVTCSPVEPPSATPPSLPSVQRRDASRTDPNTDESKQLLHKVLQGIELLADHQNHLEEMIDMLLHSPQHHHHHHGGPHGPHQSPTGNLSPVGASRGGVSARMFGFGDLSHHGKRLTGGNGSQTGSQKGDSEEVTASGGLRWPACIQPRLHPPSEAGKDLDEKVVVAISDLEFAPRSIAFLKRNISAKKIAKRRRWPVLYPNSKKMHAFDLLGCIVLVQDIFITPFILAWNTEVQFWMIPTGLFAILFWMVDIAAGFCIAFYKDGALVNSQPEVAWHFFRRQFFIDALLLLIDMCNMVVDVFNQIGSDVFSEGNIRFIRLLKLTRLLKLARAVRMARLIDRIWVSETQAPSSSSAFVFALVAKILIVTIISNHLLACLWYWQGAYGLTDTHKHWVEEMELVAATRIYQYLTSLHWSVAQMTLGASDANPSNSYERFLNIIFLLNGLVFGSTIISYLSAAIVDYIMIKRDTTAQLSECRRFLRQYQCPSKLAGQVVKQVAKRLSEEVPLKESDVSSLDLLAPTLRTQVTQATRLPHLERHQLFNIWGQIERRCLEEVAGQAVSHRFLSRDDDLFTAGKHCDEAWCLLQGTLKYTQMPGTSNVVSEEVTVVDSNHWIAEASLWAFWLHVGYMEAHEVACHLLSVNAISLVRMLGDFPLIYRLSQQYAKNYHACLTSAGPPHAPWPSDLNVPFTQDTSMLLSQHVGLGLLQRGLALGALDLSDHDEEYVTKELMSGKCTIQYSDDGEQLERVVGVTNVMVHWEDRNSHTRHSIESACSLHASHGSRPDAKVLYQVGEMDAKGKQKLSLHVPGAKRQTGESPQAALEGMLNNALKPFAEHLVIEDSETKVSIKESTQSLKMRTKTVKTIYRAELDAWPSDGIYSVDVPFPDLPGLQQLPAQQILLLPQKGQVGLYAFLLPDHYAVLDEDENLAAVKDWIANMHIDFAVL